jgi:GST-like protein
VQRGRIVNKVWGDEDTQLRERHSPADFVGKRLVTSAPQ